MSNKDSTASCYTSLTTDAYLQPRSHSAHSAGSPTAFQKGNPTAPPLLMPQAPRSKVKDNRASEVPDVIMQVSRWIC